MWLPSGATVGAAFGQVCSSLIPPLSLLTYRFPPTPCPNLSRAAETAAFFKIMKGLHDRRPPSPPSPSPVPAPPSPLPPSLPGTVSMRMAALPQCTCDEPVSK